MKMLIAAGGTGGHLFPAIAVAEELKKRCNSFYAEFIGNKERIEGRIISGMGLKLNDIPVRGFNKIFSVQTLLLPMKINKSIRICSSVIKRISPEAVLCTGAYIRYPAGRAAKKHSIPLILMESNVFPGKTIGILAKNANLIITSFPDTKKYLKKIPESKIVCLGNPVRANLLNLPSKEEALAFFGLDKDKKTLLAFGGSLGARSINEAVNGLIPKLVKKNIQLVWQTGRNFQYDNLYSDSVKTFEFIENMPMAFSAADLVVSRSGATSIAEICAVSKPSVLIPYPLSANNHQDINAGLLVDKGASVKIQDSDVSGKLGNIIFNLIDNPELLSKMGLEAGRLSNPDSASQIADRIIEIAG